MSRKTRVYELSDDMFWQYFKAFIDDADRRIRERDENIIKRIDLDTANKIMILKKRLVMDAIKGAPPDNQ